MDDLLGLVSSRGPPFFSAASSRAAYAFARLGSSERVWNMSGRSCSIQRRISGRVSGSRASICLRSQTAAVGLAPPVEMPTESGPDWMRDGNRKLQ